MWLHLRKVTLPFIGKRYIHPFGMCAHDSRVRARARACSTALRELTAAYAFQSLSRYFDVMRSSVCAGPHQPPHKKCVQIYLKI